MHDFFGNDLAIGDDVAITPKHYRGLVMGIVVGFTPQNVRVEYPYQGSTVKFLTPPETLVGRH